jgi:parallel beta-helix repeat protein
VHGQLQALATSTQPISFLPKASTTPGSWNGIDFYPGSGGRLSWCRVYYAVTGVVMQSASPRLEHTEFRYSSGPGVTCGGTAAPTVFHCRVSDNGGVGIYVTDTANPDLGNLNNTITTDDGGNTLMGNTGYDIRSLSSASIMAQNNYWGTTSLATVQSLVVGSVNYTPLALTGVAPTSAGVALLGVTASQAAGGSVAIRYCLAAPAWVSLEVTNLAGRTVRRLPAQAPSEAGERLVLWDARSDGGERLPPGKYFVTISACAADGTAARQTVPLALSP